MRGQTTLFLRIILPTDQKLRMRSNIWDYPIRKQEEDKSNKRSFSQSLPSKMLTLSLNLHIFFNENKFKTKDIICQPKL